jgi:hypothetical protein
MAGNRTWADVNREQKTRPAIGLMRHLWRGLCGKVVGKQCSEIWAGLTRAESKGPKICAL